MSEIKSIKINMYEQEYRKLERDAQNGFRHPRLHARMLVLEGLGLVDHQNGCTQSKQGATATASQGEDVLVNQ